MEGVRIQVLAHHFGRRLTECEAGAQVDQILITNDLSITPPFIGIPDMISLEAEEGAVASPMQVVRDDGPPARMKLLLHASEAVRFEVDAYEVHPRLRATTRAASPEFAAVMLPLPSDVPAPHVQFQEQPEALVITVAWTTPIVKLAGIDHGMCRGSTGSESRGTSHSIVRSANWRVARFLLASTNPAVVVRRQTVLLFVPAESRGMARWPRYHLQWAQSPAPLLQTDAGIRRYC